MNPDDNPQLEFARELHALLLGMPEGCSEYQLIQQLRAAQSAYLPTQSLHDRLVLFRTHFLLFNALYRLRDQLLQERRGLLQISPLLIQLHPYSSGTAALDEQDPLRSYYLDMQQLASTSEADVEQLLTSFWTRLQGGEDKDAALQLFELDRHPEPLSPPIIKQRYRQLVSLHHPDRGGSTARLQSINTAMEILQRYYGRA